MPLPSLPSGYDVAKPVDAGRPDCHLTVGFNREERRITRFLIILHYQTGNGPVQWDVLARMDHNENGELAHDVYEEGLHVDIARKSGGMIHVELSHSPLPPGRGRVIRACVDYFKEHAGYFIDVFEGDRSLGTPPRWPDGGESPHTLITTKPVYEDMSREQPREPTTDDVLTDDELTEVLANATGEAPEEIEQGAADIEIAPPGDGTVIGE